MPNLDNFNIDDLKETWQKQTFPDAYEQSEIETMLNKKSKNYVKYILWISLAEFLIFGVLNFITLFSGSSHTDFTSILNKLHIKNQLEIETSLERIYFWMKIASLFITGFFVLIFYNDYRKIDIESNLKKFIKQIIRFKNTVNLFIFVNVVLLILFVGGFTSFLIFTMQEQNIQIDNPTLFALIFALILALLICVVFIMVYYKLAYGILLKRLSKSLVQLEKIDSERS